MGWEEWSARNLRGARMGLRVVALPLRERFRSAIGERRVRRALLVHWRDADGVEGVGECACRQDAHFSHEFLAAAQLFLTTQIRPALQRVHTYGDLCDVLQRSRGWPFAKAALLAAVHDAWRRQGLDDPLDQVAGSRLQQVPVGISLGLFADTTEMVRRMSAAQQAGYRRVKLKLRPGLPTDYGAAARQRFDADFLGFDGNGSFDASTQAELIHQCGDEAVMVEQPFAPDRLDLHADLRQRAPHLRVCLDESVRELGHLISATRLRACDQVNIKPGRVGGMHHVVAMLDYAHQEGLSAWVGGMFETGIGRALNLRVAACLPKAFAHDLSPSSRYFDADIVAEPVTMTTDGMVVVPQAPVDIDWSRLASVTEAWDEGTN